MERLSGASSPPFKVQCSAFDVRRPPHVPSWNEIRHRAIPFLREWKDAPSEMERTSKSTQPYQ
jgi:hypothetical protein